MRVAAIALVVAVTAWSISGARAADQEPVPPAASETPAPAPASVTAPAPATPAAVPRASEPSSAAPAGPDEAPLPTLAERPPKSFPRLRQPSLLHKYQLGIAMMPGIGFRGI